MSGTTLPPPDRSGIRRALPEKISEKNRRRLKKFATFMSLYEIIQDRFVRPRIHEADPGRHREILRNSLKELQGSRILDLGCGTGAAIPLIDRSNVYIGLDLSYAMLKLAARKAARHGFRSFDLVQGNAEELLFDNASFDMVLMDTALHMIPRYQRAITEAARVLRENGVFVLLPLRRPWPSYTGDAARSLDTLDCVAGQIREECCGRWRECHYRAV